MLKDLFSPFTKSKKKDNKQIKDNNANLYPGMTKEELDRFNKGNKIIENIGVVDRKIRFLQELKDTPYPRTCGGWCMRAEINAEYKYIELDSDEFWDLVDVLIDKLNTEKESLEVEFKNL